MSAAPDQAELAPSRDPAAYGRRPLRRSGVLVWLLVCAACLAIGAVAGRFAFPPPAPRPTVAAPREPGETHAAATAPAPSPGPASGPPAADAARGAGDASLADRVARLESAAARQNTAAAGALAAASLAAAAQSGAPFDRDLAACERLAPNDPDLRALVPLAAAGAPSRAALAAALPEQAEAAVLAEREPAGNASFLARLWATVGRVVVVRRVDPAAPGLDGALSRAQSLASAGDIERAVAVLEDTPPAARARMADWLAAARRRIQIDQHVGAIRNRALDALLQSASATPGATSAAGPPG